MEKGPTQTEEESSLATLEETEGTPQARQDGRGSKPSRFIKVQIYLPLKDIVLLEEERLRLMKQGQDVSRSRLVADAIRQLAKAGGEPKTEVRG